MNMNPIPYGARCTWWDSIDKVGTLNGTLPCCPICKNVLFQVDSLEVWHAGVQKYAAEKPDPEYPAFIEWLRGRCFPDIAKARYCYDNRAQFAEDIGKGPFKGTMTGRFG